MCYGESDDRTFLPRIRTRFRWRGGGPVVQRRPCAAAMSDDSIARFEGIHCILTIRAAVGTVVVTLEGHDVGELGNAPFRELEKEFAAGRALQLFIDARNARTASMSVSGEWARWLQRHCEQFRQIS